jgi:transcriptional regulator with XRE-family HTH domain
VRTPVRPPRSAQRELGLALYRLRLERGLSLRALARQLDYSAHSVFVDVEKGLRLPSEALVNAYERCFDLPPGSLLSLRQRALVERADALTDALGRTLDLPAAPTPLRGADWPDLADWGVRVGRLASAVVRLPSAAISLLRTAGRISPR